jgi:hypothetical protein
LDDTPLIAVPGLGADEALLVRVAVDRLVVIPGDAASTAQAKDLKPPQPFDAFEKITPRELGMHLGTVK